jgi:hypothetical protein
MDAFTMKSQKSKRSERCKALKKLCDDNLTLGEYPLSAVFLIAEENDQIWL